jgi:protein-tyrosine-phosphatase
MQTTPHTEVFFLHGKAGMKDVLFVCQANVGRSQMAEGFFNFLTGSDFAGSAGVVDVRTKFQKPATAAISAMQERGIDISHQPVKLLTPEMCQEARRVVVLCDRALCPTFMLKLRRVIFRPIRDPNVNEVDAARNVRDQVEEVVYTLLQD